MIRTWQRNVLDKNHFGNSPAAIYLVDLLNSDKYYKSQHKVIRLMSKHNHHIKVIDSSLKDKATRDYLLQLVRNNFKNLLFKDKKMNLPPKLKGLIFNLFTKNFHAAIKNSKKIV